MGRIRASLRQRAAKKNLEYRADPAPRNAFEFIMSAMGVGASVARKEDDRFLRGHGQYVADFRHSGLRDVAFVRSAVAHARMRAIHVPPDHKDVVFTAEHLAGVNPIRAATALRGFKHSARADPGHGQGPLRGRDRRDVRRRLARRGRGHRRPGEGRLRRAAARDRHAGGPPRRRGAGSRGMGRQRLHRVFRGRPGRARCANRRHQGHARDPHGAALHAADRGARRRRLLGPAPAVSSP